MRRGTAVALVYLGLILVPVLIMSALVPPIVTQGNNLAQSLPDYARDLTDFVQKNDRLRQIEADRTLVTVDADVVGGVALMKRRSPIANLVAHRRLNLDDVGAVIRKQLRREGAAKYAREVDDLHARKRAT